MILETYIDGNKLVIITDHKTIGFNLTKKRFITGQSMKSNLS